MHVDEETRKLAGELLDDFYDGLREIKLYPGDDACCRILAWLLIYGGGCEDTVNLTPIICRPRRGNAWSEIGATPGTNSIERWIFCS